MQFNWYTILSICFMVFILAYIIAYPLMQRRQMKKQQQEVDQFMASLKVGDVVTLADGVIGTIASIGEKEVHLTVAKDVQIRVRKAGIVMKAQKAAVKADPTSAAAKSAPESN